MRSEEMLELSFYRQVADINRGHRVSLVQHVETGKFYVRKVLSTYDSRVYQTLSTGSFKNIPVIYACIEDDNQLILIEEYISGNSLAEILSERGRLTVGETLNIAIDLCNVLTQLHRMDPPVIHRDIKPSNLLISGDGVLKLIDFNAAKEFDDEKSRDTVLIGTVDYAAPEQYGFSQSDARTDIYAIGVLINQMLTEKLPGDGLHSGSLEQVIKKCLSMDPKLRYKSCEELLLSLFQIKSVLKKEHLESGKPRRKLREYLPPGFRTVTPWKMAVSVLGYAAITAISITLEPNKHITVTMMHFSRFYCFLMLLSIVLFWSNYLDVQRISPWQNKTGAARKLLGKIVGLAFFLVIITAGITVVEFLRLF